MRRIAIVSLYILVSIVLITIACTPVLPDNNQQQTDNSSASIVTTKYEYIFWCPESGWIDKDALSLIDGCNTFSCDLYRQFIQSMEDENFMYSPYSIYLALAMAYAGARGETAAQMMDTLHLCPSGEQLNESFLMLNDIIEQSKIKKSDNASKQVEYFNILIANALWGQKGYAFEPEYISSMEKYYGGVLQSLDFKNAPESARMEINDWVAEKTQQRITDLIAPGTISPSTELIITDAIYFYSFWSKQFSESDTMNDTFFLINGNEISAPFMNKSKQLYFYTEDDDYQTIQMPYSAEKLYMIIILPRDGKFEKVEHALDKQKLKSICNKGGFVKVDLSLPKFKYESSYQMSPTLIKMGMTDAFSPAADFSGITPDGSLFISDVNHKTIISVDEKGTEAAAATKVSMRGDPIITKTAEFIANRPFIYLIQHRDTGVILFMGRVMNPAAN
jgi:serpin B